MEATVKMTQCEEIIDYLQKHGTITRLEAACKLHIFELSSRIGELIQKGYNITSTRSSCTNINGRRSHFNVYRLEE